jgi:hypothetical protein
VPTVISAPFAIAAGMQAPAGPRARADSDIKDNISASSTGGPRRPRRLGTRLSSIRSIVAGSGLLAEVIQVFAIATKMRASAVVNVICAERRKREHLQIMYLVNLNLPGRLEFKSPRCADSMRNLSTMPDVRKARAAEHLLSEAGMWE